MQTKLKIGTVMYSQSILIQKLLMALMRLDLETTVIGGFSLVSASRDAFFYAALGPNIEVFWTSCLNMNYYTNYNILFWRDSLEIQDNNNQ